MKVLALPLCLALLPLVFVACGSTDDEPATNGGAKDASAEDSQLAEGGEDTAAETGLPDAGEDAREEAGEDAGEDAEPLDASPDGGPDAAPCTLAKPYSSLDQDCNACAEKECCVEINACLLDPECDDSYVNCILACSIDTDAGEVAPCIAICDQDYPNGKAEYEAAIGCADAHCAVECE